MAPPVDRVPGDPTMPTATSVVVIGGGIIGVCTAFFLARKGIPVVLCEKGEIRSRTIQPQLGLVPQNGPRPA